MEEIAEKKIKEVHRDKQSTYIPPKRCIQENFYSDIIDGLSYNPKKLPSKYFYDEKGDQLFQQIMSMPEYYLTRCELDIFSNKTSELATGIISDSEQPFDLIELGAGDAMKSSFLLKYLVREDMDFRYIPIDISGNILSILNDNLRKDIPDLDIVPLEGEYFDMLEKANSLSKRKKIVLLLGSNIGNMERDEIHDFFKQLNAKLNKGDIIVIGFDLKKNPSIILNAYNDRTGITAAFNLNLLTRINRELGADFDLRQFQHYQNYDPISGACRSYLVSLKDQKVTFGNQTINFRENEPIEMEISQKFSLPEIEHFAQYAGFDTITKITDAQKWFVDAVWQVK
ncbi:L-histidine N(alpha)-methyltransferase [Sphingobacterium gobiense]|uniref:L-histidine N(Alpha)-methyltransferase n=1 Tax=Sphingobacterium gobiense TaxID=1382456 RepID=A0A2S9JND1_9SPHI|nr:L-histidine N(alpha)-methyltransferase [Sphingobacterium gobiense]PRD54641.1 L-histidine N(alpha)-methyltransferase [Sphingobacterium gobiense]